MITRDGVAGLAGLAGALLLLWASRGLPHPALVPIGPAFYPRIVLTVIALLSAALLVVDLISPRRVAPAPTHYRLVILAFVIFTGYVVLLPVLGYRVATFLFVGGLQVALEPPRGRRWALVLAVALGTALVTYVVFESYLTVLLPRGRLTGF
jgi:putative tricarboxylic transport membrane protein